MATSELPPWIGVFTAIAVPVGTVLYNRLKSEIELKGTVNDHEKRIKRVERHVWPTDEGND